MTTITTPLSQQRLLLEVCANLPILTDEILEDLKVAIAIENNKRNAENPLQTRHWCNLTIEEQEELMQGTSQYAEWKSSL